MLKFRKKQSEGFSKTLLTLFEKRHKDVLVSMNVQGRSLSPLNQIQIDSVTADTRNLIAHQKQRLEGEIEDALNRIENLFERVQHKENAYRKKIYDPVTYRAKQRGLYHALKYRIIKSTRNKTVPKNQEKGGCGCDLPNKS